MLKNLCFQLNIRQKIIMGMILFSLCFGGIAALSYSNIVKVENKVMLVEKADDFSNVILEIRRLEKNYFLYGSKTCVDESKTYIRKGLDLLKSLSGSLHARRDIGVQIMALQKELGLYDTLLQAVCDHMQPGLYNEKLAGQLRESGQKLVEQSKEVTRFERRDILRINTKIRNNILLSIIIALLLVIVLIFFVTKNVIAPLRLVEDASRAIGQGRFTPLQVTNTHDEIQRVIMAFNSMVNELATRQGQLVQAQKLSSLGTLTAGIAHQLNNPLNNISTSCQILTEELGLTKQESFTDKLLHNIGQETNRARDIVKGLLEFSRHQEFSIAPNNLHKTVTMAIKLISSQLPPNITIKQQVPETMMLLMDRQRMHEVFLNLIMNAIQAIAPDAGSITITASQHEHLAHIEISDTGSGVLPEDMDRIFDPFYTTKDVGSGTGLGLSVAYGIIKKHNGTISVASTPGKGTCFSINLPMAQAADEYTTTAPGHTSP
ncbi:MAG: HAMP domain-containing sensor histidine kinase [Desulfoplanes sp.]